MTDMIDHFLLLKATISYPGCITIFITWIFKTNAVLIVSYINLEFADYYLIFVFAFSSQRLKYYKTLVNIVDDIKRNWVNWI